MKKITLLTVLILASLSLTSCLSTKVTFNSNVEGADVYVDGEHIGKTPVTEKIGNGIWNWPDITVKKAGYKSIKDVQLKKEVKVPTLVLGILFEYPLLWVYGPCPQQYFVLEEETKQTVSE